MKALEIIRQSASLLLRSNHYYYNVFKHFNIKEMPGITIGVAFHKGKYTMVYNPTFVELYSPKEFVAILEHEMCHFTFDHLLDASASDKKEADIRDMLMNKAEHYLQNIAKDRSINVYIEHALPQIRIVATPEMLEDKALAKEIKQVNGQDVIEAAPITREKFKEILTESGYKGDTSVIADKETWQYYYDLLKQCPDIEEQMKQIGEAQIVVCDAEGKPIAGTSDTHMESDDQEKAESKGNQILVKAYEESNKSKVPGHLAARIKMAIDAVSGKPLPWNVILRRYVNSAMKSVMEMNMNIRNRFYGDGRNIVPGYIDKPLYSIAVVLDTSGSVFDEAVQKMFWTEVEGMRKSGADIDVYQVDTEVKSKTKYTNKFKVPEIEGGGGTDLDVGLQAAIADKKNIIILLTDGYSGWNLTRKDFKGKHCICVTIGDDMPKHYGPTIKVQL